MLLNTGTPLDTTADFCSAPAGFDCTGKVSYDLADKFGTLIIMMIMTITCIM